MSLTNEQLLMLDNLIYTKYVSDGKTVREIITDIENDGYNVKACEMTASEWKELVAMVKNEPTLLDYTVTNYKNDSKTGMRAACFVNDKNNPTDVNVVFRGTSGDYEWHDNGEGGYLSDTEQQELAAEYVNNLPENYGDNMTVTGHSKGGNKAQYVTIVTDRIGKCISYDGQGFSPEFLEKYANEIAKKSNKITSISASEDFVNCLLYSIAGECIYIETEKQDNFLHNHKPNILFDKDGKLRKETEQSDLSKFINEYTTYMISNLEEPERSLTIDGIIALLEKGENKESLEHTLYALVNAGSHLDDFVFDYIGDEYGVTAELITTYIAATICPVLFFDDFINAGIETIEVVIKQLRNFADEIKRKLESFAGKISEYAKKFEFAINNFINKVKDWVNSTFSSKKNINSIPQQFKLDTYKLSQYAQRIQTVNRRISKLDRRLDGLYWQVGLQGLWNLMQADLLTGYSWRLNRCASYLNTTATNFNTVENKLKSSL